MRRIAGRLLAAVLVPVLLLVAGLVAGVIAAPAASAAPAGCLGSSGYPVGPSATVQVSSTGPRVDEVIEVSGVRFCGNEKIVITYQGAQVATARTDAAGSFDPPVKVTGPAGEKQICARGETDIPQNRDCITITSRAGGTDDNRNPDSGTTASTGSNLWIYLVVALVLLAAGVVAVAIGRRRRDALR